MFLLEKNSTLDGVEVSKYFSDKLSDAQQRLRVINVLNLLIYWHWFYMKLLCLLNVVVKVGI